MAWTKEQQQAIDESGTNIIVSAGAGSGKTAVLTARTMRIISEGIHVNELLILTFTKAAAAEMKERIRRSLKELSVKEAKYQKELELIDQSYITTFDSFALSVVKKYHYLLNLPKEISISDSSIIALQQNKIMETTFDECYKNPSQEFTKLIYDFCVKDDRELKEYILKIATKIDNLIDREAYLNSYLEKYFSDNFIEKAITNYLEIIKNKILEIKELSLNLEALSTQDYNDLLNSTINPLYNSSTLKEILQNISIIKLPPLPRGSDEELKTTKAKLKDAIDKLEETLKTYGDETSIKENILSTKPYLIAILHIIKTYLNAFHKYKEENKLYDFQDIAFLAIKILREYPEVREELKNTFKEIMIDEYQDTNDIQETFISLISNHNVYMVGDIKQSIYRFRNANPFIFKNKYDAYAKKEDGIKIDLVKNFRSRREVLANINEIFNYIMDDQIGGAEYHESHQMVYGNNAYIEQGLTDYDYNYKILEYTEPEDKKYSKEEIEIFTIAKDIKEKINSKYQVFDKDNKVLRDIQYSDIVILMDRSTSFDLYKKVFEYMGIPLTLYKDEKLNNSDDIYIIKNIINYIIKLNNHEYDTEYKYSFVSIARSFLFNLTDEEIFACFNNNDFIHNVVYETINPISKNLSSTKLTSILERIITSTKIYEKLITIGNIEQSVIRLSKLLDIAENLNSLGYDIYAFRDYLNELLSTNYDMKYKVTNTTSDAVKIMTIHTSKGLEYHICYYSGLYKEFNIRDLNDRFLIDNEYGIISPFFKDGINETMLKYLVKNNYLEQEISEKIRLFYVALTRAKEQMILLTPAVEEENFPLDANNTINSNVRLKYRSFSQILNTIKSRIINNYEQINLDELNLTKAYLSTLKQNNKLNSTGQKFFVEPIAIQEKQFLSQNKFSKTTHELITNEVKKNMKFGLEVHEILEYLDFKNPNYDLIEDRFLRKKIQKFLSEDLLKNIKEATIYKEYEFLYVSKNEEYHGIIDLMLEYEEKIDIIDYKLKSLTDDNYLKQLSGYKEYISQIVNKEVNIYLYSILNETIEKI